MTGIAAKLLLAFIYRSRLLIFNRMVNDVNLDRTFEALAHQSRRAILTRLQQGSCHVGELYELFDCSQAAVSKHIARLEAAGLIRREIKGRIHYLHLEPAALDSASEWMADHRRFWAGQLVQLKDHFNKKRQ